MATLNLSSNGPSISASYQKIVTSPPPTGAAASSPTYGQWAVFTVQAPLVSAFQQDAGKESVLKVQTTGEGELIDLVDDFSDGRIQFAFVKVKDPNTTLPKNVLIAWCGEGVPERTKGYFTSHLNAVARLLHGYHVQITARSDRDLTPDVIVQKVADSSGSKYSGGGAAPASSGSAGPPPPAASKPVMPTESFGGAGGFQPLGPRSRQAPAQTGTMDEDGWGADAPPVTRSQLEKVESAYQPTRVDMNQLQSQQEPSRYQPPPQTSNGDSDAVKGGYQPVGKVDIAALRRQAQEQGPGQDERPTAVRGAYEPVGKVDIADIRRRAQGAPPSTQAPPPAHRPSSSTNDDGRPKSLADRSSAFTSAERLTSLPRPQVANRFGSGTSNFTGTKAPTPAGFGPKSVAPAAPVGAASRTFADQGGKTPAQLWEEKKRQRGMSGAGETQPSSGTDAASPIKSQASGNWQSGYAGKKWGVQIPTRTGGSGTDSQQTGQEEPLPHEEEEEPESAAGGVSSIRDRFKDAAPMGAAREPAGGAPEPPALDTTSKPNAAARAVPIPGLPTRPSTQNIPSEQHQDLPPPPPRPQPADEPEEEEEEEGGEEEQEPVPQGSPVRIAMPVARGPEAAEVEKMEPLPPRPVPTDSLAHVASEHQEPEPEPQVHDETAARSAGQQTAVTTFGHSEDARSAGTSGGKEAIASYDYDKAEENELELKEGERITNIDMIDEDWWMGQNSKGETGLFPSNYVELVGSGPESAPPAEDEASAPPPQANVKTAVAQYEYEAAEDNELSFPENARITDLEFPDDDWWFGHYRGKSGLFPANYVTLDE